MGATHFSGPVALGAGSVEVIDAAKTLVAKDDNGKTFFLDAAAGATVTLPALHAGGRYKFIVTSTFATSNWVIASSEGDNINGFLIVNDAAIVAAGEDQINFVASAESIGDYAEFIADTANSQWIVHGHGEALGSATATDPS